MPSLQSIPSLQTTHAQSTWRAWIYPETSVRKPPLSLENRRERREKVGRRVGGLPTLVQPTALTERP